MKLVSNFSRKWITVSPLKDGKDTFSFESITWIYKFIWSCDGTQNVIVRINHEPDVFD